MSRVLPLPIGWADPGSMLSPRRMSAEQVDDPLDLRDLDVAAAVTLSGAEQCSNRANRADATHEVIRMHGE